MTSTNGAPLDFEAELRGAVNADNGSLTVPEAWEGFPGRAFGGFLAGAVLVAASARTEHPRPLSLFSRYYRPSPVGRAVRIELAAERRGNNLDTFAARLFDGDRLLSTFSVAFGRDGEAPLSSQALVPPPPLVRPQPVWQYCEEIGVKPERLMRRVGYRAETEAVPPEEAAAGWNLRSEWPATTCDDPAVRAAVAVMAIDVFVGPATMRANGWDLDREWPLMTPSLDLNCWFYAPEAQHDGDWLTVRTSVPVTQAGYAVGRTQVWAGDRLIAEGMSQVALVLPSPAPST